MNCVVKWPGSVHDARIMRECPGFGLFETVPRPLDGFILGDSGYMLREWLLTPYIHAANAPQQRYHRVQEIQSSHSASWRASGVGGPLASPKLDVSWKCKQRTLL